MVPVSPSPHPLRDWDHIALAALVAVILTGFLARCV